MFLVFIWVGIAYRCLNCVRMCANAFWKTRSICGYRRCVLEPFDSSHERGITGFFSNERNEKKKGKGNELCRLTRIVIVLFCGAELWLFHVFGVTRFFVAPLGKQLCYFAREVCARLWSTIMSPYVVCDLVWSYEITDYGIKTDFVWMHLCVFILDNVSTLLCCVFALGFFLWFIVCRLSKIEFQKFHKFEFWLLVHLG